MPNYGHAVSIGALIDAGIAAHEAADLAARADEAGLDLALFTDPDDAGAPARSSDPLALATWAAGRTERITVGAAGLKMTNRQPSVLARAAGSLSALSGNRAVLSLRSEERRVGKGGGVGGHRTRGNRRDECEK